MLRELLLIKGEVGSFESTSPFISRNMGLGEGLQMTHNDDSYLVNMSCRLPLLRYLSLPRSTIVINQGNQSLSLTMIVVRVVKTPKTS